MHFFIETLSRRMRVTDLSVNHYVFKEELNSNIQEKTEINSN